MLLVGCFWLKNILFFQEFLVQEVLQELGVKAADLVTTVSWAVFLHNHCLWELTQDLILKIFDKGLVWGLEGINGCEVTIHGGHQGISKSSV
jgi:hypothetical protein